jgi:hypothetical protein
MSVVVPDFGLHRNTVPEDATYLTEQYSASILECYFNAHYLY